MPPSTLPPAREEKATPGGPRSGKRGEGRGSARRRLRQTPREGTRATSLLGRTRSHPPSSPPRTHRTQIHTHRPERRGLTPRPPPSPPPAVEVQQLPPAAMTPHLAPSGGPRACDSSGSLRPHLHLTPRTRPSARRPAARARGIGGARRCCCAWGRGDAGWVRRPRKRRMGLGWAQHAPHPPRAGLCDTRSGAPSQVAALRDESPQ